MKTELIQSERPMKECWRRRLSYLEERRAILEQECCAMPQDDDIWMEYAVVLDLIETSKHYRSIDLQGLLQ